MTCDSKVLTVICGMRKRHIDKTYRRSLHSYLKGEGVKKKIKEKSYKISLVTINNQTKTFFISAGMYDYNEHIFY